MAEFDQSMRRPRRATAPEAPTATFDAVRGELAEHVRHAVVGRDAASYLRSTTQVLVEYFGSPHATVCWGDESDREFIHVSAPFPDDDQWCAAGAQLISDVFERSAPIGRVLQSETGKPSLVGLAVPLPAMADEGMIGAIAVLTRAPSEAVAQRKLRQLVDLSTSIAAGIPPKSHVAAAAATHDAGESDAIDKHRILARAGSYETLEGFAHALTNALRSRAQCSEVMFGEVRRSRIRLLSVSGIDEPKLKVAGTLLARQAMEECLDLRMPVAIRGGSETTGVMRYPLHEKWSQSAGGAAILTVPILNGDDEVTAVLSFVRSSEQPFDQEEVEKFESTLSQLGIAVPLLQRSERSLLQHVVASTVGRLRRMRSLRNLLTTSLLVGAIAWFAFGTISHNVVVPCQVAARQVFHIGAPFEGRIASCKAKPGQMLKAGDLICEFDVTELKLKLAEVSSELESLELEVQQAAAGNDMTRASLLSTRRGALLARQTAIDHRIKSAVIRATEDGMILRGDLSGRLGQIVPQGEPLFEFVPTSVRGMKLEVQVPEEFALDVHEGMKVLFASSALPEQRQYYTVETMLPAAELRGTDSVFVAEAPIPKSAKWMRPGMEGTAEVDLGEKPVWRVMLFPVVHYLYRTFWL